jgi:LAS superfamily LD-carboxypeptidase LdcB
MLFKSFFEKFQSTPKTKNNWLMPFRKSSVKVNMKSVKFDRMEGFKSRNDDIFFTESKRSAIFPNLQKIDSNVIDSGQIPLDQKVLEDKIQNKKLFSKIHDTRKYHINFGLVILIILILIITSIGLYFFSSNKLKDKKQIVDSCNKYVSEQKSKGFVTSKPCDLKLSWYDNIFADSKASAQFESIKKEITKQTSDQQIQIAQLDKDIRSTKQNLANIDPNFEKDLQNVPNTTPVTISEKQTLLNTLKILLNQKDKLITTNVSQFNYLVRASSEVDSQKEQTQLKSFDNLAKTEKYSQYNSLIESFNNFKQKLLEKNGEGWFAKSLDNPELYKYKLLVGDEFKNLIDNTKFDNTTAPNNDLISILGDDAADKHIIQVAESRGYKKRPVAVETSLISSGSDKLQTSAKNAFDGLVSAAGEDNIRIGLVSGYRSINDQKSLFQTRFRNVSLEINKGKVYSSAEIVSGKADEAINKVLSASSIPGYSRHHTGYTIDTTDLNAKNDFTLFAETAGYKWMSANNYFNAKRFGFAPSYPTGASNQGPEPESWEYVYVGADALK